LRQSLSTREQWFGKAHPLVADTLFALAELMGKADNSFLTFFQAKKTIKLFSIPINNDK
jgi:hypothetical protein